MTTTFFTIQEKVNNEWKNAICNVPRENVGKLVGSMMVVNAEKEFRVVRVEMVDTEETLTATANKIESSLSIFNIKFDLCKYIVDGDGFLEMRTDEKYPSFSIVEIRRMLKVIDEVNADLPEGYEVSFSITHECAIRLFLSTPKKEEDK